MSWRQLHCGFLNLAVVLDPCIPVIYTLSLHDALPISLCFLKQCPQAWPCGGHGQPQIGRNRLGKRPYIDDTVVFQVDRKSTRLNSSHLGISYAVFCLEKKKNQATVQFLP